MRIAYTPEQERLRLELRDYFGRLMTDEVRAAIDDPAEGDYGDGDAYRAVVRQLGQDGWLALSWPREHGGRGGTMIDQLIFTDEAAAARVPVPFLTVNTVGPTIMRFGTPPRSRSTCPGSPRARSTSPSATRSRRQAPTWRRCGRPRRATATTT